MLRVVSAFFGSKQTRSATTSRFHSRNRQKMSNTAVCLWLAWSLCNLPGVQARWVGSQLTCFVVDAPMRAVGPRTDSSGCRNYVVYVHAYESTEGAWMQENRYSRREPQSKSTGAAVCTAAHASGHVMHNSTDRASGTAIFSLENARHDAETC